MRPPAHSDAVVEDRNNNLLIRLLLAIQGMVEFPCVLVQGDHEDGASQNVRRGQDGDLVCPGTILGHATRPGLLLAEVR